MKNFKLFKLLLLGVVLITSMPQMWATNVKRYYCEMKKSWWTNGDATGNASIGAYLWKSDNESTNNTWPGVKMTWTGLDGIWYIDIDTDTYDRVIFTRLNSSGNTYWGHQTNDLSLSGNYYEITQASNPGADKKSAGTWHSYRYLDGNEPIYVKNVKPIKAKKEEGRWDKPFCDNSSGNRVYAFFCNGSSPATYIELTADKVVEGTHQLENAIYSVKPVQGFYQNIIVVRVSSAGWDGDTWSGSGFWNKTGDIAIPTTNTDNLLADFQETWTEHTWSLIKHKVFSDNHIYMYYDNSNTSWSNNIQFMIGRDGFTRAYPMSIITGTKLYYVDLNTVSSVKWEDATYYAMMQKNNANITTSSGYGDGYEWAKGQANHYTSSYSTKYLWAYELDANQTYLATTTSGDDGTSWTITWKGESSTSNYTYIEKFNHTVNVYTKTGTSYGTANNSPATVTVKGYEMTGNGAATQRTGTVTKSSAKTVTLNNIVTTSQLDYAYSSLDALWHFDGWAEVSSGPTSTSNTYSTGCAKSAKTVYAFFSKKYTVSFDMQGHGSAIDNQTILAGNKVTKPSNPSQAGYSFGGWYKEEGCTNAWNFGSDVVTANTTLFAKWTEVELTFDNNGGSGDGMWNTSTNWEPACVPTIKHNVTITKPVTVDITTAKAKSVKIYNDGTNSHTGKLTIGAGNALVVAEDIQKTINGSTKIATTADVLHIEAGNTSDANGALVWGTSGTPGAAQVDFFTKSHGVKGDGTSINQYIGTPFSNDQSILYQYYYSWLFKIKRTDGVLSWDLMAGDESMNEFEGYNLITAYDANTTYQMEGTLVSNANVTLSTSSATGLPNLVYTTGNASNPNNENVLANSWVAPIRIAALSGFSGVESTIYIFNAGSETPGSGGTGDTPGNYSTYSISGAGNAVIPSMQSFSVYTNGSSLSPSITLNYNTIVKSPLSSAYYNSANKAPARNCADEMQLLKVRIDCENGWADELKIYIHEDFTNAFEDSWDAHKMYGYPEAPQLYAVTTDGNMAINCVPTADNNVLGFTPGSEDNEYTFSFTYDGDEEYYLKDTKLNIETLINTEATYTFTSEAEDSEMRFIIIKRAPAVATDAETVSGDRLAVSGVQKIMHNGQLYIIRDGGIYSTDGQMVK